MPMARSRRARATENPCRGRENVMFSALGSLWLANSFFQAEPKAPRRENNAADLAPLTAIQQNSFTPKPAPSAKQAARDGNSSLVELIDGERLVDLLEQYSFGLRETKTFEVDYSFLKEYPLESENKTEKIIISGSRAPAWEPS